jgi:hypothetical protein
MTPVLAVSRSTAGLEGDEQKESPEEQDGDFYRFDRRQAPHGCSDLLHSPVELA